jgi:hypothetical protein
MSDQPAPEHPATALGKLVLESHRAEYKELSENWRILDTKAQGATAISGIFLAAAFSIARDASGKMVLCEKVLLILAIASLVTSITLAVLALWVRSVSLPPIGEQFEDLVADLPRADLTELPSRLPALVQDESRLWKEASKEVSLHNESKARLLRASVTALLVAAIIVSALTIWAIL